MTMQFDLEHDGFVGEFHPGARYPGKAVLYVGGASCDRKMTLAMGRFIEDAGFSVLYLGFYLWEGLPKEMWRIPVDYAERAAKWLISHGYEPCMMGASTGAGYTLLSASLIPEIHGAAALCPFDHVMEGMELFGRVPHCSVYQFHGEEYPYSKFDAAKDGWIALLRKARRAGVSLKGLMRWGYETALLTPESRIRVENINGDVLLTTTAYDIMWPADEAVGRMSRVLEDGGFSHRLTVKVYECCAHGLGVGGMTDEMGGRLKTALAFRAMGVKKELADKARQDVLDWLDAWAENGEEHEGL
ncbi:MAG: hypothetical protein E7425_14190 [Ruminococcaceae bacterium]|nr:hypothetical protein [Oscillospiraceae bacterium]